MTASSQFTNWIYFPQSDEPTEFVRKVVTVFKNKEKILGASDTMVSNDVLAVLCEGLESLGFHVETGKKASEKINVPVLYGINGAIEKSFDADAWHREQRFVLEVEAGRGYANNQFLKDLFQCCMMHDVDYCGIAVRNKYRNIADFEYIRTFFDTLYTSRRLKLPLKGVLLIGYGPN